MNYDAIVIGAGPAGLTAALYLSRANKKTLVIESYAIGGQAALTQEIENFPGIQSISGFDLATAIQNQAQGSGAEFIYDNVIKLSLEQELKSITTEYSGEFTAKNIILALGAKARPLGIDNEKQLVGRGVSYCATCDGNFYKNKSVAIVGGGDTALTEAIYLSDLAKEVYIIHRRDEYRGSVSLIEKLREQENIKEVLDSQVVELIGSSSLEAVRVKNNKDNAITELNVQGIFVAVGNMPQTEIVKDVVALEKGYIITDEDMKTNIKGVYAIGDVRKKRLRQVITACADGAIAATHIYEDLV